MKADLSPMMVQYQGVKDRYPGYIVLFRVGDFFETFGEDAHLLSKELDLLLTSRQVDGSGKKIPLAGVPHHALDTYLARLVRKGHRVVICDQVEDPKTAKGLVKREVTRVVTPGTVLEESLLAHGGNNYLAAWAGNEETGFAVALVDVSTGETLIKTHPPGNPLLLMHEIASLTPREILLSGRGTVQRKDVHPSTETEESDRAFVKTWESTIPGARVEGAPEPLPLERLPPPWHEAAGTSPLVSEALGIAASYVERCEPRILPYLSRPLWRRPGERMALDIKTLRHLEVTEPMNPVGGRTPTLLDVVNVAETPPGRRTVESWLKAPLADVSGIESRLQAVAMLLELKERLTLLRAKLKGVGDLSRLSSRVIARRASPKDLLNLGRSLQAAGEVKRYLTAEKIGDSAPLIVDILARLAPEPELAEELLKCVVDDPPSTAEEGGALRPENFPALNEVHRRQESARDSMVALEKREAEATGIKNLKIGYTNVFGYYFEVTRTNQAKVPHDRWRRKQTLASSERFTSSELQELETQFLATQEEALAIERTLWETLMKRIEERAESVKATSIAIGEIDALAAFASVARDKRWVRPRVHQGTSIKIREGRHPVLEEILGPRYVPNDTVIDGENVRLLLLTGPNMAGKSTYMRQVGLIVLLAQAGSFVPAKYAEIGLVSHLATRMGFTDEIGRGKSSFMVEMMEVAEILERCDSHSLVLLDEVGRGTGTSDGLSIAWAIIKYLHDKIRARTILATHYHQLAGMIEGLPSAMSAHLAVKEDGGKITFLRTLLPGATDKSYGIHVAELAGIPDPITKDAKKVLQELVARDSESPRSGSAVKGRAQSMRYTQGLLMQDSEGDEAKKLAEELKAIDVDQMTPVEALNKLHQLSHKARKGKGGT
jgi:DNA mismatch repair protein MutS